MTKRGNLRIHGVEENPDIQTKGIENLLTEIIEENFQNHGKDIESKVNEAFGTRNRNYQKWL
jgi:hypothetical protein